MLFFNNWMIKSAVYAQGNHRILSKWITQHTVQLYDFVMILRSCCMFAVYMFLYNIIFVCVSCFRWRVCSTGQRRVNKRHTEPLMWHCWRKIIITSTSPGSYEPKRLVLHIIRIIWSDCICINIRKLHVAKLSVASNLRLNLSFDLWCSNIAIICSLVWCSLVINSQKRGVKYLMTCTYLQLILEVNIFQWFIWT